MSEATIKFKTQADLDAMQKFIAGLIKTKDALNAVQEAAGGDSSGGGSSAHLAASGAPPPAPRGTVGGHGSAPPPPPVPTATGPAPASDVPAGGEFGGQAPTPFATSQGQLGAPPPAPIAPTPPQPTPGGGGGGSGSGIGGGGAGRPTRQPDSVSQAAGASGNFLSTAAGTAVGLGLGTSISGFVLGSGQKYLELSKIITHLDRRFRDASESAIGFGGSLGYTMAQTAQFVDIMGGQTNAQSKGAFTSQVGFARAFGADPGQTLQNVGTIERLMGTGQDGAQKRVSEKDFAELMGAALSQNMDKGRLGEFLETTTEFTRQMFQATGQTNIQGAMNTQSMIGGIFGDERGRGAAGASFGQRLSGVMTQSGPMRTFMMRSMGFGTDPNIGYIEMRKRLEAGIHDPRNLASLFGSLQNRGLGKEGMFKAIESVAGDQLKAHELEKLVEAFNTPEELANLTKSMDAKGNLNRDKFVAGLSKKDRAAFMGGGLEVLSKLGISRGDERAVKLESAQFNLGDTVSQVMLDSFDSLSNLVGMVDNILGFDMENAFGNTGKILVEFTKKLENITGMLPDHLTLGGMINSSINQLSAAASAGNQGGISEGLKAAVGMGVRNLTGLNLGLSGEGEAAKVLQMHEQGQLTGHAGGGK